MIDVLLCSVLEYLVVLSLSLHVPRLGSIRDLIILFFSVNLFCKNTISYEGRLYFYSHGPATFFCAQ